MDIEAEYFYITPDELDAGAISNPFVEWNTACRLSNFVLHNGEWNFKLPNHFLENFMASLQQTTLSELSSKQLTSTNDRLRYERALVVAHNVLGSHPS